MSVRSNSSGDNLLAAASLGISTGAFNFGFWVKLIADRNDFSAFVSMTDNPAGSTVHFISTTEGDGTTLTAFTNAGEVGAALDFAMSVGTWYWVVIGRDGSSNFQYRVFDDSASTTPLDTDTVTSFTEDFSACDNFIVGQLFAGEWSDAEFANVKVHTGVYWTDAQCRTESQNFEVQTGGGTVFGSWRLEDVDADADGINDGSGGGHHFTNTGFVAGASRPTQLEAIGGGGGGFVPDEDYLLFIPSRVP